MMLHGAVVLAVALAAAGGKSKSAPLTAGQPRVRQIVLEEQQGKVFEVRTAWNVVTTVEFPEEMLERPLCPDCVDASAGEGDRGGAPRKDALFRLEASATGRYLAIWPNSEAARRWASMGEGVLTSLVVQLEHATLTLVVQRVDKAKADTRVVFVAPNRAAESEYLRVEKAKLEAEAAARIKEGVTQRFLQAFRGPHHCERSRGRARHDDVVLEVNEICSFGRDLIITFTVENRGAAPLEVGRVTVSKGSGQQEYLPDRTLEFDEMKTGVVAVEIPEGADARGPYEVTVYEKAGKRRVVTVGGIEI